MTTLKCIVVDDDFVIQGLLSEYIHQLENVELLSKWNNPSKLLASDDLNDADVIFLDIETPVMDGIEFLESTKLSGQLVLMTSSKEYAFLGFENNATDFLLKPVSFDRFEKAIEKVISNVTQSKFNRNYIFVKLNKEYVKLNLDDILYVTAASEYLNIYTNHGKFLIYSNMTDFLKKLDTNFIKIHRSHIIALDKIERVNRQHVIINGQELSVSKSHADDLFSALGLD